jgi:nucleoside-diphosphate-sugar epimerase
MQILVTDVTSAVGRAVARQLVAAGHAVAGIARHPHEQLDREVDLVCAPLGDPVLQQLADDAHVVLHLAPIDPTAPGSAGINGVVHVAHAAARAGSRLIFVSQAAGKPELYRRAERLVSTGWGPSLIVRIAPPLGRQLDWMVCRTVATLLRSKDSVQPIRLLHPDDLVRFLALAVTANTTGVVDLATPDTTNLAVAAHLLRSVEHPSRRSPTWEQLTPNLNVAALQDDWQFELGWSASDAVADAARGLLGRKLGADGATTLPGHLPLPSEPTLRSEAFDGAPLDCAAPDGLEGEFDDRIDPRFPVFSAAALADVLPGPLTPMTLDVQLGGLRMAARVIGQAMALGGVVSAEWGNRAIAVFGHRPYVGVSASVIAASQLPGWEEQAVIDYSLAGAQVGELLPLGSPLLTGGLLGSAAKAVAATRALAMLRHLKTDTQAYRDGAAAEHLDPAHLSLLPDAELAVRVRLLRDRIEQGWGLTALWLIDTGVTPTALERTHPPVSGVDALLESQYVDAATAELAAMLRCDARVHALAEQGDLAGIRARFPSTAVAIDSAVSRIGHRAPAEAELANPVFGDDPAMLLVAAATAPAGPAATASAATPGAAGRRANPKSALTATSRLSREMAYNTTMRFTHELRMTLREFGFRRVAAELLDAINDVYYLTCEELLAMPGDARLRIKRRRAERERLQALRLPTVINHTWEPLDVTSSD